MRRPTWMPRSLRPGRHARTSGCAYSSSAHTYRLFRLLKNAATRPARTQGLLLRELRGAEKGDYRALQKSCQVGGRARVPKRAGGDVQLPEIQGKFRAPQARRGSAVPKVGRTLLEKGRHAFLLVFRGKERMKHAPLEQYPLGQRHLVGAHQRLLGHQHAGK